MFPAASSGRFWRRKEIKEIPFQSGWIDSNIVELYSWVMKVTVDIPDADLADICRLTGESCEGPAVLRMVTDALMMKRREQIARKFVTGEWGVELEGWEADQEAERIANLKLSKVWQS